MKHMTDDALKTLCLALLNADTEQEVIQLLEGAELWSDSRFWRLYGDRENNFSTIGGQQSRADAALVEKLVNSEDARLMSECLTRKIDPAGSTAPKSIREAVALFFDSKHLATAPNSGRIAFWSDSKRRDVARGITLSATGFSPRQGKPCFTIADCGEGQTPDMMPETLLSLDKANKLRIPFVQGKFNMGGTGILRFCGKQNLELVISKRNPSILNSNATASDRQWGFTIVRRQSPNETPSTAVRNSVYTYLAPLGAETRPYQGTILSFSADELLLFPEGNEAYSRPAAWGTVIKLYEFGGATSTYSNTHILLKDGLLSRLDLLLAEPALPIRLHECRSSYRGHGGSFDTTLTGLIVRLEDQRQDNLEPGFPLSCPLSIEGENMIATIFAFKKGKADTYRRDEGIIFTVNGQTHGNLSKSFFSRKSAGRLNYIADSLLVVVDCSDIGVRAREDLFMNSRDRLSNNPIRQAIESQLEIMLRENPSLRALKERRRAEEIQAKLAEEKPLEEVLQSILKQSPTLASLFLTGTRASNPFHTVSTEQEDVPFEGKTHPMFFKFKGKDYGTVLVRDCHLNQRARVTFETDAVNEYFSRQVNKGIFSLARVAGNGRIPVTDYVGPYPNNGIATLNMELPANCTPGDNLEFEAVVSDPTLLNDFTNRFCLTVKPELPPPVNGRSIRRKPPSERPGQDREVPSGITMPQIIPVYESEWASYEPVFDKYTALRIGISDELTQSSGVESELRNDVYDFKINMDNLFLKSELKNSKADIELTHKRWQYALVLLGLALLHDDKQKEEKSAANGGGLNGEEQEDANRDPIEERVEKISSALAPVLLPMIESLGALEVDEPLTEPVGAGSE